MRTEFWSENLKGRDRSEDLGVDGRILEWIQGNRVRRRGLDASRSVADSCEHG